MAQISCLTDALTLQERKSVIEFFWKKNPSNEDMERYEPYLQYYQKETQSLAMGIVKKDRPISRMAAQTHAELQETVRILSNHRHSNFSTVQTAIKANFPKCQDSEAIKNTIDLGLRVWLTLNVRNPSIYSIAQKTPSLRWEDGTSGVALVNFVGRQFPSASQLVSPPDNKINVGFTAYKLVHTCGVTIEWTSCLADHLHFDFERRCLRIYHYRVCLSDHYNSSGLSLSESTNPGPILPKELLQETIWSLDLLFPAWDKETDSFLREQGKTFHNHPPIQGMRPLDLNQYKQWRERLTELRAIYMAEPTGLSQLWHNRRNLFQWLTLWTAMVIFILTVVFGIISSVTAIIQTKAALRSLDIAIEALKLQKEQMDMK